MTAKLNAHQQALIDVLGVNGGWMRRTEIAHALGRGELTPEDVMQLDLLGDAGLVVKEISDNKAPGGESVRYRMAQPKAEARTQGSG